MSFVLRFMLLICMGTHSAWADEPALLFPPMTGRVVDAAQLLDTPTTARLSQMFQEHEEATGEQIVVVTLVDLQGTTIEDYGVRLGRAWGVGQQGKDNGALLIVARDNRKVRIEVGAGLQDRLSDAQSSLIINMLITPEFREGNFATGIERGAQAMVTALGGHVPDEPEPSPESAYEGQPHRAVWPFLVVLVPLVLFMAVFAMTNLGRRLRLKGSSAVVKHEAHDSCSARSSGKRFAGGGASGNW